MFDIMFDRAVCDDDREVKSHGNYFEGGRLPGCSGARSSVNKNQTTKKLENQ